VNKLFYALRVANKRANRYKGKEAVKIITGLCEMIAIVMDWPEIEEENFGQQVFEWYKNRKNNRGKSPVKERSKK